MRAVGFTEFGGPEQLHEVDVPEPHPWTGEIRIRVHAATVNPTDTVLRAGGAGNLDDWEPPWIPGMDAAGVVSEVSPDVDWQVGDRVMALVVPRPPAGGAYADEIVVPAASVARIPEGSGFPEASTLLMNAMTARVALDKLTIPAGGTVAVTGAAGSFGGYVVQLAKADGLRVIADAAPADQQIVSDLGADEVVPRGPDIAERIRAVCPDGVDGVADGAVQDERVLDAIRDEGGVAVVRGWRGEPGRGIGVHRVMVVHHSEEQAALDTLRSQVEQGALTLRVADVLPAAQAAEAHRRLEAGGVRGRLVLDFS